MFFNKKSLTLSKKKKRKKEKKKKELLEFGRYLFLFFRDLSHVYPSFFFFEFAGISHWDNDKEARVLRVGYVCSRFCMLNLSLYLMH